MEVKTYTAITSAIESGLYHVDILRGTPPEKSPRVILDR
jgi:hypothetical protein